jgi:hypothetical protein
LAAVKPPKNDPNYQLLEVCIWHGERRIVLYEFGEAFFSAARNSYHEWCGGTWECPEVTIHRENASLYEAKWDQKLAGAALSAWLAAQFSVILGIAQKRKGKHYGLSFAGHGSTADGALFEGMISPKDTRTALKTMVEDKFALINFGGNCVEGKWNNLEVLREFGDYVIASDLNVNGLTVDKKIEQEYLRLHAQFTAPNHMLYLLKDQLSPENLGAGLLEGQRKLWEFGASAIEQEKLKQSMALYDMQKFQPLRSSLKEAWQSASTDVRNDALHVNAMCDVRAFGKAIGGSTVDAAFLALRVGYVSTADMFTWDVATSGLGFNFLGWNEPPCDIAPAVGGSAGVVICALPPEGFSFQNNGGGCETYGPGGANHKHCNFCVTEVCELRFQEVCPECGVCDHIG